MGFVGPAKRRDTLVNSFVNCQPLNVHSVSVNHISFVAEQPQKKGIRPIVKAIKYIKCVSWVNQLFSDQPVINIHTVAQNLPVAARLHQFWKTWIILGASPKVIRILKEGYTFPFWKWPTLIRSLIIINGYVHPLRKSYLREALHALI